MGVLQNYDKTVSAIGNACKRTGIDEAKIKLLVVTKYAKTQDVALLLASRPVNLIGESRLGDSLKRWADPRLADFKVKKFFIGRLQTNKAAKITQNFDVIGGIDGFRAACAVNAAAFKQNRTRECLIQVKLTDKETQGGVNLEEAQSLINQIKTNLKSIRPAGLMAIAPITEDENPLRGLFKRTKELFDANFSERDYLSIGMSGDFEIAIEEGGNLPRIGSAIFGRMQ
jgi:pyridoxal phosphate enzyme (YggS family)